MSALVTIEHTVPAGTELRSTARLHGNGGSGDIDWVNPVSNEIFDLFPDGAGIYGYGHAPYGHHRFGHSHSMRTPGYGHVPYGHHPYGHGAVVISADVEVDECGAYKFGFACYDEARNPHAGTPDEETVHIHIAPAAPDGLKLNAYNKTTDVLTLDVA